MIKPELRNYLAIALLGTALLSQPSCSLAAGPSPLSSHIAPGKWALSYQRTGELKPLFYKHKESGTSSTCIKLDPRQHILDWVASKGCRVDHESLLTDRYRLSGQCRLKWLPGHPVPVDVDLIFGDAKSFTLDIRTRQDALLSFQERTLATFSGQCAD